MRPRDEHGRAGPGPPSRGYRGVVRPPTADEEADLEIEHHLVALSERLRQDGLSFEAARAEAERRFGRVEAYRSTMSRAARMRRMMMHGSKGLEALRQGLTGARKTIKHHPGFVIVVVSTLALGIGANATMFRVIDRLLLQPPSHVDDPSSVFRVGVVAPRAFMGDVQRTTTITHADYLDLKAVRSFEALAAWSGPRPVTVGSGPEATKASVAFASWDFFELLGVQPSVGRFFSEEDDAARSQLTAVLGHEYWEREYAAAGDAVDRTMTLSGEVFTVVGVAPEGFTGVGLTAVDIWIPLTAGGVAVNGDGWIDNPNWYWLSAVARVASADRTAAAADEATAVYRSGRSEIAGSPSRAVLELDPLIAARGPNASRESKVARWLGGVSLIVLLVACANVASLLLARGVRRRREMAVRLALGAGRARLVSTVLAETIWLALLGAVVALILSSWGGAIVQSTLLPGVVFDGSALDARLVAFTVLVAVLAGGVASIGPAIAAARSSVVANLAMGAGVRTSRSSQFRTLLTVAQAALSVVLLIGAGWFVRSVSLARSVDLGLEADELIVASVEFDGTVDRNDIYQRILERVQREPGVDAVAGTSVPFPSVAAMQLTVPGLDSLPELPGGGPFYYDVTPGYLSTVGLPVILGRDLAETDRAGGARVTVVSNTMAETLWPDADPLGQCLLLGPRDEAARECTTVVGVVEDSSRGNLAEEPFMALYLPIAQRPERRLNGLLVRTTHPAELAATLTTTLQGFDPSILWADVRPLRDIVEPQARAWSLAATLFSVFGLLALAIAAVGLYGALAFDVAQRTRELGIRSALGAARSHLMATVLVSGMRVGGAGIVLGLAAALSVGRFAEPLLFNVSPYDFRVIGAVVAALACVVVVASLVPGVRATRVEPVIAMRVD